MNSETTAAVSGSNRPKTLSAWIKFTQDEQPPAFETRNGAVLVYGDHAQPTPFVDQPPTAEKAEQDHTASEQLAEELPLLWADLDFWKLVHSKPEPYRIKWYIQKKHGFVLPEYPPQIWKQLVKAGDQRAVLFAAISGQHWRWTGGSSSFEWDSLWVELSTKWFKTLIEMYFSRPHIELTHLLASQNFSEKALKSIKAMARRLAADADWCLKHQGEIPPTVVKRKVGRPEDLETAQLLEALVLLVCANPDASDGEIARLYSPGETDDTIRKAAQQAKQLARWREGAKVRFHKARGAE